MKVLADDLLTFAAAAEFPCRESLPLPRLVDGLSIETPWCLRDYLQLLRTLSTPEGEMTIGTS